MDEEQFDLTTFMYEVCFPFSEPVDVHELIGLWTSVDPCGADVAIQIQTHVFSTPNGGIPISSVAHLRSMTDKVDGLEQIGRRVEGILEVLQENVEVVEKVRNLVYRSLDMEVPDEYPENDFSLRHSRTASLTNAVRSIHSAPLNAVTTVSDEVVLAFDLERARFFFQGDLPRHERLTVHVPFAGTSVSITAARIFAKLAERPELEAFVTSLEFDSVIAKMELAIRFYNDFTVQLERSITYFQAMFASYETASTFVVGGGGEKRAYKRYRDRESTLDIAIREGVFTPTPSAASPAVAPAPAVPAVAPAAPTAALAATLAEVRAAAAGNNVRANDEQVRKKHYLPRLPAPLGFEPEEFADGAGGGGAGGGGSGRRQGPCPVRPPCASALFAKVASSFIPGFARASQVYARLPDDHVVKQRFDEFFQRDLRMRYFPTLAKILVNYAPRDAKTRTRRIGDMLLHHKLYVHELYRQEHARVLAGGEVQPLEELTAPCDFSEAIGAIFADGELETLVAPYLS
jgi:hypothetical protein